MPATTHGEPVLHVRLEFHCCGCGEPVGLTLRCQGRGLQGEAGERVAALPIDCPTCGRANEVLFEPRGKFHGVRPYPGRPAFPEPSTN